MKKKLLYELRLFFTVVMFFSRLPVPRWVDHNSLYLQRASKYFPWMGIIVGAIAALATWLCLYVFSVPVSIILGMIVSIWVTGAFHEDGFADVCDGFGGGWTKEKILSIMKDSRLGTYGVIGLVALLSLKFILLKEIINHENIGVITDSRTFLIWLAVITWSHSTSRFAALTILSQYNYVSEPDTAKSRPFTEHNLSWHEWLIAVIPVLIPMFFLPYVYWLIVPVVILTRLYLGWYFNKWIGGYTGDCLGAMQQVCETVIYLSITVLWKFT